MRHNVLATIIAGVLLSSLAFGYSGGAGTSGDPYQIASVLDWQTLMATPADWSSCFILTAEIDMAGQTVTPVGNGSTQFTGVFDGNGHIISNLTYTESTQEYVGLFGYVGSAGQIRNLGVEEANIQGRYYVGGLVGFDAGTITTCYATGTVSGSNIVGGLVGGNSGSITTCYATGTVSGSDYYIGGLVGNNYEGTITDCYATGNVTVTGTGMFVGGLVGENDGTLTNCYATGSVSGGYYVGGLVGYNNRGTITECYATGAVSGNYYYIGGLCGRNDDGTITDSYWDTESSGQAASAGGWGLTSVQMKQAASFAGWNDGAWTIEEGVDTPRLIWENRVGSVITTDYAVRTYAGSGTANDPYRIVNGADLVCLGRRTPDWSSQFVLMGDIDLSELNFTHTVIAGGGGIFTGVFDGDGHVITNLSINGSGQDYIGLFGQIDSGGQVKNIGLAGVNIVGGGGYVGGLVGRNSGTITTCYATGTISGGGDVGGLVGNNSGTLISCYATGSVSGGYYVGGLVGRNSGTITTCYATGTVGGGGYVGGLVGNNSEGTITECYATGAVSGTNYIGGLVGDNIGGTITDCYATGNVSGSGYVGVGGLLGQNYEGTITTCYATGNVSGSNEVGGLVGVNYYDGTITTCYEAVS
jgi:hypothetical protein